MNTLLSFSFFFHDEKSVWIKVRVFTRRRENFLHLALPNQWKKMNTPFSSFTVSVYHHAFLNALACWIEFSKVLNIFPFSVISSIKVVSKKNAMHFVVLSIILYSSQMRSCECKLMDCLWETSVTWQDSEVRCWRTQVSFVLQHWGKFRRRNCLFPSNRFHLRFWSPERCGRSVLAPNFGLKRQETLSLITRSYYRIIGRQNIRKKQADKKYMTMTKRKEKQTCQGRGQISIVNSNRRPC